MNGTYPYSHNNFDLIRLFAAIQVLLSHAMGDLKVHLPFGWVISYFPGVPIFFFVSGFLISASYERVSILKFYARNRFLRIYQALIVCLALTVTSIWATGYKFPFDSQFVLWIFAQSTIFQFYNLESFRNFGLGVANGALWTISVELTFYILIPLIYSTKRWKWGFIGSCGGLFALSVLIDSYVVLQEPILGRQIPFKLLANSIFPYLWMFLVGVFAQQYFGMVRKLIDGHACVLLFLYLAFALIGESLLGMRFGNHPSVPVFLLLALLLVASSTALNGKPADYLGGKDLSYGIYIYHMPIVNLAVYYGFISQVNYFIGTLVVVVVMAWASWEFIERPALKLKLSALHKVS